MEVVIKDNSDEFLKALPEQIEQALTAIGLTAESYAKRDCPVDTGRLRNSITHVYDGDKTEYIGTNVEYAKYVELNDRAHHTNGQAHFLRDAAKDHADKYRSILQNYLENAEG